MSSIFTIAATANFTLLIVFILIMVVCWVLTWNVDTELKEMNEELDESQFEIKGE